MRDTPEVEVLAMEHNVNSKLTNLFKNTPIGANVQLEPTRYSPAGH